MVQNSTSSSYRLVNRITGSAFDLVWLSSLSYLRSSLCYRYLNFFVRLHSLPFGELSLVGLAIDMVDLPLFFSDMRLLVGSSHPLIIVQMTGGVSSGTLIPAIAYRNSNPHFLRWKTYLRM